jgi:hypothetical protein
MDALIARADAIRPLSELKKGKGRESSDKTQPNVPKLKGKAKAKESNDNDDYTLQSISSRASIQSPSLTSPPPVLPPQKMLQQPRNTLTSPTKNCATSSSTNTPSPAPSLARHSTPKKACSL